MASLNRKNALELLAIICQRDPDLCKHIKFLILSKIFGKLNAYAQGDLVAQSATIVAGNVRMGAVISEVTCAKNDPDCRK